MGRVAFLDPVAVDDLQSGGQHPVPSEFAAAACGCVLSGAFGRGRGHRGSTFPPGGRYLMGKSYQ